MASERIDTIRKIATRIVCTEIGHPQSTVAINRWTEENMEELVNAALDIAKRIVDKTEI